MEIFNNPTSCLHQQFDRFKPKHLNFKIKIREKILTEKPAIILVQPIYKGAVKKKSDSNYTLGYVIRGTIESSTL